MRGRERLSRLGRLPLCDVVLRSPALCAAQTAEGLAIASREEPRLRDCDFGRWAGRSLAEVRAQAPQAVDDWLQNPHAAPHGGECFADVTRRVGGWMDGLLAGHGSVLAITHASVIRAAIAHPLGAGPETLRHIDIAPLTRTKLSGSGGRWTLAGPASPEGRAMSARQGTVTAGGWRCRLVVVAMLLACAPVRAHYQSPHEGPNVGIAIPAITHGEMPVVAKYRAEILDRAARQPRTDPTLRRLAGFVSLQHFACFWGLVPGSLADEASPFNECSHADVAGARALLAHMAAIPGDQSPATALEARIETELASDPGASAVCSNSTESFDSGIIIGPDCQLAPAHLPTVLTFFALAALAAAGILYLRSAFAPPLRARRT